MDSPTTTQTAAEHRRLRRKKGKRGMGFSCRKGKLGLGKDIAVAVQDVSEEGARLLVKENLSVGAEVEICLVGVGMNKRLSVVANVMWCKPEAPHFSIGVKFQNRLSYGDFFNLT